MLSERKINLSPIDGDLTFSEWHALAEMTGQIEPFQRPLIMGDIDNCGRPNPAYELCNREIEDHLKRHPEVANSFRFDERRFPLKLRKLLGYLFKSEEVDMYLVEKGLSGESVIDKLSVLPTRPFEDKVFEVSQAFRRMIPPIELHYRFTVNDVAYGVRLSQFQQLGFSLDKYDFDLKTK